MFTKAAFVAFLAGLAAAYHAPVGEPTGNAITAPLVQVIPAGKPFTIQWKADSPNKVSLILLKGPSTNAVFNQVIVEGIANTGSYTWTPPTTLQGTDGPGGYGIQLIDDVDGHYQYSTQFGISNNKPAESSSSAPAASSTPSGYKVSSAASSSSSAYKTPAESSSTSCTTTSTVYVPAPSGTGYSTGAPVPSSAIYPTGPVTVPSSLKPTGTGYPVPSASPTPSEFPGAASGLQAGLGLAGAVAGLVFML